MKNSTKLLTTAALGGLMFAATSVTNVSADHHEAAAADGAAMGECHGINSCKGTGACGGAGHGCAGKNECKGHGWLKMSKADCEGKGGTFKE